MTAGFMVHLSPAVITFPSIMRFGPIVHGNVQVRPANSIVFWLNFTKTLMPEAAKKEVHGVL